MFNPGPVNDEPASQGPAPVKERVLCFRGMYGDVYDSLGVLVCDYDFLGVKAGERG